MVDVAHDLGCLGEDGRGHIGIQKMLGKVDIVMGSFSKTFASNGGFVADPLARRAAISALFQHARRPSPTRCRRSRRRSRCKAFEIVNSAEGTRFARAR